MDELAKIGNIQTLGDILDFKLSIKTISILAGLWGFSCMIIILVLFGGVDNTIKYFTELFFSLKKTIVDNKINKNNKNDKNDKNDKK